MDGHVALWERRELSTGFWQKNLKKRNHFEGLSIDGQKILKLVLNSVSVCGPDLSSLVYRPVAGYCRHNIESSGYLKCRKCLQYVRNCQLLKDCVEVINVKFTHNLMHASIIYSRYCSLHCYVLLNKNQQLGTCSIIQYLRVRQVKESVSVCCDC